MPKNTLCDSKVEPIISSAVEKDCPAWKEYQVRPSGAQSEEMGWRLVIWDWLDTSRIGR